MGAHFIRGRGPRGGCPPPGDGGEGDGRRADPHQQDQQARPEHDHAQRRGMRFQIPAFPICLGETADWVKVSVFISHHYTVAWTFYPTFYPQKSTLLCYYHFPRFYFTCNTSKALNQPRMSTNFLWEGTLQFARAAKLWRGTKSSPWFPPRLLRNSTEGRGEEGYCSRRIVELVSFKERGRNPTAT